MPPREDLLTPGAIHVWNGHHLMLERMDANNMNPYAGIERTYTFREVEPVVDMAENEEIEEPVPVEHGETGGTTIDETMTQLGLHNEIGTPAAEMETEGIRVTYPHIDGVNGTIWAGRDARLGGWTLGVDLNHEGEQPVARMPRTETFETTVAGYVDTDAIEEITGFRTNDNGRIELNHDVEINIRTPAGVDTDGDIQNFHAENIDTATAYAGTNDVRFELALTDKFKGVLKPFIQQVLKELLEQEGFIVGHLPKEGA